MDLRRDEPRAEDAHLQRWRQLGAEHLRQSQHCVLAGGVQAGAGVLQAEGVFRGCDAKTPRTPRGDHSTGEGRDRAPRPADIHSEDPVEFLRYGRDEWPGEAHSGIGENHVHRPKVALSSFCQSFNRLVVGDIALTGYDCFAKLGGDRARALSIDIGDHDRHAAGQEFLGQSATMPEAPPVTTARVPFSSISPHLKA